MRVSLTINILFHLFRRIWKTEYIHSPWPVVKYARDQRTNGSTVFWALAQSVGTPQWCRLCSQETVKMYVTWNACAVCRSYMYILYCFTSGGKFHCFHTAYWSWHQRLAYLVNTTRYGTCLLLLGVFKWIKLQNKIVPWPNLEFLYFSWPI